MINWSQYTVPEIKTELKILAFPVEDMENLLLEVFKPAEEVLRDLVHGFKALEQIILIEEKRDQPKESKRKMSFATAFFAAVNPPSLSIPRWMPSYSEDSSDEAFNSIVEVVQEIVEQDEALKAFKSIKIHYAEFT